MSDVFVRAPVQVLKGGVGEASGLRQFDVIIKINDDSILGWSHYKVNSTLKKKEVETLTVIRQ